ncbi:hypothetical protein L1987_39275 [Smallanthus sonchifolius]|uniref:Uncharacterized protein n=1 Tax=Smallanthus sonchifolius TaxID=185202 RepID=A0ACB9HLD3_9ASTR|nr:hypothetical protein L1987_39275 [Smallanthus sonchifolius]
MADIVFEKLKNGQIKTHEGDYAIHEFVEQETKKHEGVESVRNVCNRIGLLEPDPRVRDKIIAHFFTLPDCVNVFRRIGTLVSDEGLTKVIRELKDHLTYLLFPMAPEFDRGGESRFGLGFGGALMRSLAHVPKGPSTYFLHDWK